MSLETKPNATLVTHGPYRWIRHPYYTLAGWLMVGVFLLSANLLIGTSCLVVFLLLVIRTKREEQLLIERFGQSYIDYRMATGMFLPSLTSLIERR